MELDTRTNRNWFDTGGGVWTGMETPGPTASSGVAVVCKKTQGHLICFITFLTMANWKLYEECVISIKVLRKIQLSDLWLTGHKGAQTLTSDANFNGHELNSLFSMPNMPKGCSVQPGSIAGISGNQCRFWIVHILFEWQQLFSITNYLSLNLQKKQNYRIANALISNHITSKTTVNGNFKLKALSSSTTYAYKCTTESSGALCIYA